MLTEQTLDKYRTQLVEGEPCPLCGSESHPYVHEYAKDLSKVDEQYNKAKSALEKKRTEVNTAELKKLGKEKDLENLRNLIAQDKSGIEESAMKIEQWKKKLSIDKIGSVETVEGIIVVHEEKLAAVEYCINYTREQPLLKQLLEELVSFDQKQADLQSLNKEITALYSGTDIQKDYKQRRDAMQSALDDRKQLRTAIRTTETQREAIEANICVTSLKSFNSAAGVGILWNSRGKVKDHCRKPVP